MGRFTYIGYDEEHAKVQTALKTIFELAEHACDQLEDGRAKALCLTKLEESYMWAGKSIRDSQIKKNSPPAEIPPSEVK